MSARNRRKFKRFFMTCAFCLYLTANITCAVLLSGGLRETGDIAAHACTGRAVLMTNVTADIRC